MGFEQEAARWMEYAQEDLAYGHTGADAFPRAAAWSFQQAAEKALKACLIIRNRVPPRTHDLVLLANAIDSSDDPELQAALLLLAEISASARYPDDTEPITRNLAREYGQAAQVVIAWAKTRVGSSP